MKKITILILVTAVILSCQQKKQQYFSSSPEIDLVKKCDESYLKSDWAANRAFYHDTAVVQINSWPSKDKITPDQAIDFFRNAVSNYQSYSFHKDTIYEMIITDDGQHWVHCWTEWQGVHKSGKAVRALANISWRVENGKIVAAFFIIDSLPDYLANKPDSMKSAW